MRRPFQRCVYRGGSACSCWDIALWVRRPTLSLLEAEKSVDKGLTSVTKQAKNAFLHGPMVGKFPDFHRSILQPFAPKHCTNHWWSSTEGGRDRKRGRKKEMEFVKKMIWYKPGNMKGEDQKYGIILVERKNKKKGKKTRKSVKFPVMLVLHRKARKWVFFLGKGIMVARVTCWGWGRGGGEGWCWDGTPYHLNSEVLMLFFREKERTRNLVLVMIDHLKFA